MRSILKSRLGRASVTAVLAGLAVAGLATNASAYDGYWRGGGGHGHAWGHHEWHAWHGPYHGGWYRPYYYGAPVVTYPYGYYAPSGLNLNFNVPL